MINEKCAECVHCEVCAFTESETAKAGACDFYDAGHTGHWEYGYAFADGNYCKCSKCKEIIKCIYPMHYCPNCGAKMVESQETETWNGMHAQITAPKGTFERIFNDADDDNDI